jgi:pimeloyl-ACP methyl ester carboxylesterase
MGWSDPPSPGRRTLNDRAEELHRTLTAAGVAPPYLLVGHSMGGAVACRFAVRYPGDLAGMVLVDSSHEEQFRRLGLRFRVVYLRVPAQRAVRPPGLRRLVASAGAERRLDAELAREVPSEHIAPARAIVLSSRQRRANVWEMILMARSHGQPPDLGSLPVTVITALSKDPRWASRWNQCKSTWSQPLPAASR